MSKLMTEVTQTVSLITLSSVQYLLLEKARDLMLDYSLFKDSPGPRMINFTETVLACSRQLSSLERELAKILSQYPLEKISGLQARIKLVEHFKFSKWEEN